MLDGKYHIVNYSLGSATIKTCYNSLNASLHYYEEKSIIIVAVGMCDASPRPVPECIRKLISQLREKRQNKIISFLHNNRSKILRIKSWYMVPKKEFISTYRSFLYRAISAPNVNKVIVINIPPVSNIVIKQSCGVLESITEYNKSLKAMVDSLHESKTHYLDIHSILRERENCLTDDGHISKLGHEIYASSLYDIIKT